MLITGSQTYQFEPNDLLGKGSQGTVVSALIPHTGQNVALKLFKLDTTQGRRGYEQEKINHERLNQVISNVNRPIDAGTLGSVGFLVFEQYDCDLFTLAFSQEGEKLPIGQAKIFFRQICKSVLLMHNCGIAHLDLKPENVLIDRRRNQVALCDFGAAYIPSDSSRRGRVRNLGMRGSERFVSPEMKNNPHHYDPLASDIYSLGVMLYALVTGYFPRRDNGSGCYFVARDEVPFSCRSLLEGMLESQPTQRYTIKKVLRHPWLNSRTSFGSVSKELARKIFTKRPPL